MKSVHDIIKAETLDPPARVTEVMNLIRERHAGRVQAMVYYGSYSLGSWRACSSDACSEIDDDYYEFR